MNNEMRYWDNELFYLSDVNDGEPLVSFKSMEDAVKFTQEYCDDLGNGEYEYHGYVVEIT